MNKTPSSKTNFSIIAFTALALSGCSYFDINHTVEVPKSTSLATTTEELIDSVPEGLIGDTENARYTGESLRNNDEN